MKLWDVTPECTNLDAIVDDLVRVTFYDDDEILTADGASGSGTCLGSNDFEFELGANDDDLDLDPFCDVPTLQTIYQFREVSKKRQNCRRDSTYMQTYTYHS